MQPFQNDSRTLMRPTFSGLRPSRLPAPPLQEDRPQPAPPGPRDAAPSARRRLASAGTGILLFLACFLILNHFGRPFEKVLVGFRIPAMLCVTAILVLIIKGKIGGAATRVGGAMIAFMAWMVLITPLSSWRGGSLSYVGWYLSLNGVLFLILPAASGGYANMRKLFYISVASCLFHIVLGGRFDTDRLNLQGTFGNADDVALLAGFAIPFGIFAASQIAQPFIRMLVAVPVTGFLLYCIGLTATRAAIIGLAGIVIVYMWRVNAMQRIVTLVLAVVALMASVVVLPRSVVSRFATIVDSFDINTAREQRMESEAMASVTERYDLLMDGIYMTLTNPIVGVGPGQYPHYRHRYLKYPNGQPKIWFPSHNTYIQISSESGFPGIFFYLLFLATIYKTIRNCYALNKPNAHPDWKLGYQMAMCLEVSFVYFVICAAFMTCDQHPHQFLTAGLAIALEWTSIAAIARKTAQVPAAAKPANALRPFARPRLAI